MDSCPLTYKRKKLKRNGGKQQDEGDAGEIHLLPVHPSIW